MVSDKEIGGPALSEKEFEDYKNGLNERAQKEGWTDKLFGRFESNALAEENRKEAEKKKEQRKAKAAKKAEKKTEVN